MSGYGRGRNESHGRDLEPGPTYGGRYIGKIAEWKNGAGFGFVDCGHIPGPPTKDSEAFLHHDELAVIEREFMMPGEFIECNIHHEPNKSSNVCTNIKLLRELPLDWERYRADRARAEDLKRAYKGKGKGKGKGGKPSFKGGK